MFTTSETTERISKAVIAAQSEMPTVQMDATNPYFKSRYASLAGIWKAVRPILSKHGLAVIQSPGPFENGIVAITTRLIDKSGEWYEATMQVPVDKSTPQGVGAAITYGKRYALSAVLGIVTDEDTDGHSPSDPPKVSSPSQRKPLPPLAGLKPPTSSVY